MIDSIKLEQSIVFLSFAYSNLPCVVIILDRSTICLTNGVPMSFPQSGIAQRMQYGQMSSELFNLSAHSFRNSPGCWIVIESFAQVTSSGKHCFNLKNQLFFNSLKWPLEWTSVPVVGWLLYPVLWMVRSTIFRNSHGNRVPSATRCWTSPRIVQFL